MLNKEKKIWRYPWLFPEGFAISFALIISGVIIEVIFNSAKISLPVFPNNVLALIFIIAIILLSYYFYKATHLIKWLSSIPAAVTSIISLVILSMLMGILPQNDSANSDFLKLTGLSHIFQSAEFIISCFYLIIILGFTIVKRAYHFSFKSTGFILNHLGLWIIIISLLFGSGDIKNLSFYCYRDKPVNKGFNRSFKLFHSPFAIQLVKFEMEEYPPHLVLFENKTGKIIDEKNNSQYEIIPNKRYILRNNEIVINKFIEESACKDDDFFPLKGKGSCPSALLTVKNSGSSTCFNGWVTCGSDKYSPVYINVDNNYSVTMSVPEPKKFISFLKIIFIDGNIKYAKIQVNKPFSYNGWKFYQVGYDTKSGKYSDYSIIQAVYDPWLSLTYSGIIFLIAGSLFLLLHINNLKEY
jgi:hypothetical protein